jgi:hypothetical protein
MQVTAEHEEHVVKLLRENNVGAAMLYLVMAEQADESGEIRTMERELKRLANSRYNQLLERMCEIVARRTEFGGTARAACR